MNCQIPAFVAATLALQTTALSADADSRPLRVLLNDGSGLSQPVKVTAQVGERVVVCGQQGKSVVEVVVRKLPPKKRAFVYVDVRPMKEGTDIVLPIALPIGRWFRLVNANSGHCLAVKDASTEPGAKLVQVVCDPQSAGQLWRLIPSSDGEWFTLQNRATEQVMSLPDGRKNAGANLIQSPLDETVADQQWRPLWVKGNRFVVLNRRSSQALAVAYGARHPGATICQWPLHIDWQQHQWRLEVADLQ